jgi:ATP-dependent Clp protease protease subunit
VVNGIKNVNMDITDSKDIINIKHVGYDIFFYSTIDSDSTVELISLLKELENNALYCFILNGVKPIIKLHINSDGGSLLDSLAISDTIRSMKADVYTYIEGACMSGATLISIVGTKRFITPNSKVLIHQLSAGTEGKSEDIKDFSKNCVDLMDTVKKVYLKHTKFSKKDLDYIVTREIYLDADACLKYKIVDKIVEKGI